MSKGKESPRHTVHGQFDDGRISPKVVLQLESVGSTVLSVGGSYGENCVSLAGLDLELVVALDFVVVVEPLGGRSRMPGEGDLQDDVFALLKDGGVLEPLRKVDLRRS